MSSPWGADPGRGESSPYGSYGAGGPVDPYAGQASPPLPVQPAYGGAPGWQPVSYAPRQTVPGTMIAGTVVGYLFALLLFVSGLFLLFFGTVIPNSFDEADSTLGDGGTSLLVAGFGNWLAVVLLVTSGVMVSVRRAAGLILTVVSAGLVALLAVYWVVLYPDGGVVFWAFVHLAFTLVSAGLVLLPPGNRRWLSGSTDTPTTPAPHPAGPWG